MIKRTCEPNSLERIVASHANLDDTNQTDFRQIVPAVLLGNTRQQGHLLVQIVTLEDTRDQLVLPLVVIAQEGISQALEVPQSAQNARPEGLQMAQE